MFFYFFINMKSSTDPFSKGKPAVLFRGFKYNWHRNNKNSTVYICRETVNGKQCNSTFTINNEDC
jgi:hypothetical protein